MTGGEDIGGGGKGLKRLSRSGGGEVRCNGYVSVGTPMSHAEI